MEEVPEATSSSLPQKRKIVRVDVTDPPVPDHELISIYRWLDSVEFSRTKKTSAHRDFADGVMMAELVAYHVPRIINVANYTATSATSKKRANWEHLNSAVFRRLRFIVSSALLKAVSEAQPGMIERILRPLHLILMLGPVAVSSIPRKLQRVKSRYMEIKKKQPPITPTEGSESYEESQKVTSQSTPNAKRPTSAQYDRKTAVEKLRQSDSRSKSRKDVKDAVPVPPLGKGKVNPQNTAKQEVLSAEKKISSDENGNAVRPSTEKTLDENESMKSGLNSRPRTVDAYDPASPTMRLGTTTPWPPIAVGGKNTSICLLDKGEMQKYCESSSSGLAELDDDDDQLEEIDDAEDLGDDEFETDSNSNYNPKRKIKRVVKYEYREEYILNGLTTTTASYSSAPQEQENSMRSANKGYGGV